MFPTSIAGSMRIVPPSGQRSPSSTVRMSAKRASKSRPGSTPRRCMPLSLAPGHVHALLDRRVGDHLDVDAHRAR